MASTRSLVARASQLRALSHNSHTITTATSSGNVTCSRAPALTSSSRRTILSDSQSSGFSSIHRMFRALTREYSGMGTGASHRITLYSTTQDLQNQKSFISTTATDKKYSDTDEDTCLRMQEYARELVREVPVGEFSVETWIEADNLIHWWATRGTVQSMQISLLLLERLQREQYMALEKEDILSLTSFLNMSLVQTIMSQWHFLYKQPENHPHLFSPQKMVQELDRLCEDSPTLCVGGLSLSLVLNAVYREIRRDKSYHLAEYNEGIWKRMVDMANYNGSNKTSGSFFPSVVNLNTVLASWSECGRPERALAVLESVDPNVVLPNLKSYNMLMAAHARLGLGEDAESLLNEMCRQWLMHKERGGQDDSEESHEDIQVHPAVRPDVVSWNTALSAWAKSSDPRADERAQTLLARMYDPQTQPSVKPDIISLNTVMACCAKAKRPDTPARCLSLLREAQHLHEMGELMSPPDMFSYATVLNAYAKAGQPEEAEKLVNEMYQGFMQRGERHLAFNLAVLTSIMEAWARKGNVNKTIEAFVRIRELHELGLLSSGPDQTTYNVLLGCLFYCFDSVPDSAAATADKFLQDMLEDSQVEPNAKSYAFVIQCWLKTPGGKQRALELTEDLLEQIEKASCSPDKDTDCAAVKAVILAMTKHDCAKTAEEVLRKAVDLTRSGHMRPMEVSAFGSVITAWRESKNPNSVSKAEALFKLAKDLHAAGLTNGEPDALLYRAIIRCLIDSGKDGSALKALKMLKELRVHCIRRWIKCEIMIADINKLMNALADAGLPREVEQLLFKTRRDFRTGKATARPTTETYNIALRAWTGKYKPKPVDRVNNLLDQLNMEFKAKATTVTYNYALQCWAQSGLDESAERIEQLLQDMNKTEKPELKPNVASYGWLVKAHLATGDVNAAIGTLKVVWDKYEEGDKSMQPDRALLDMIQDSRKESSSLEHLEMFQELRLTTDRLREEHLAGDG